MSLVQVAFSHSPPTSQPILQHQSISHPHTDPPIRSPNPARPNTTTREGGRSLSSERISASVIEANAGLACSETHHDPVTQFPPIQAWAGLSCWTGNFWFKRSLPRLAHKDCWVLCAAGINCLTRHGRTGIVPFNHTPSISYVTRATLPDPHTHPSNPARRACNRAQAGSLHSTHPPPHEADVCRRPCELSRPVAWIAGRRG